MLLCGPLWFGEDYTFMLLDTKMSACIVHAGSYVEAAGVSSSCQVCY